MIRFPSRRARARRPPSLRWRIVVIIATLLAVTNAVVGVATVVTFQRYLVDRLDSDLRTASARVVQTQKETAAPPEGSAPPTNARGNQDPNHDFIGAPGQSANTVVAFYRDGSFAIAGYADSRGKQHRLSTEDQAVLKAVPRNGTIVTRSLSGLGDTRVIAKRVSGTVIITALPVGPVEAIITRLTLLIAIVAFLGVAAAATIGAIRIRKSLRPLERVATTAASVTALDLERGQAGIAVRVDSADLAASQEVHHVGTALNRLLSHVSRALRVRDDAERSVRAFVADASHELRTPIATIRAYAELTAREDASPAVHRNVDRITAESIRMGELVEELLLLARLDSAAIAGGEHVKPVRSEVDLSALLAEATADARAAAPDHRWVLQLDETPIVVQGDGSQLRRAAVNLLANARTHTPPGTTVVVSAARRPAADTGADTVQLTVANDGPEIPPDVLPTIFERFTRGDTARARTHGTTGLGLAIVRAVVEAHDGSVRVTSGPGRTAFTIELPAR